MHQLNYCAQFCFRHIKTESSFGQFERDHRCSERVTSAVPKFIYLTSESKNSMLSIMQQFLSKWYFSFTDYLSPWTNSIKRNRAFKLKVLKVITAKMKMFLFEGEIIYPLKSRGVTFHQCSRRVWKLKGHKSWVLVESTTVRSSNLELKSGNADQ